MIRAGIDVGAHSLRLILDGQGLVFDERALAAFNDRGDILAIGNKALELRGTGSDITVKAPIEEGLVDIEVLEAMLGELCYEFRLFRVFQKTALVVSCPTILKEDMIERIKETLLRLGADEMYFDQEIWISAIGSGLDLFLPVASCMMNIGYSNCDIALFREGKMEARSSSRHHNGEYAAALVREWLRQKENLDVAPSTIDQLVQNLGSVRIVKEPRIMTIRGIDGTSQSMRELTVNENDMAAILAPLARGLGGWVSQFLEQLPASSRRELRERGIIASGGTMKIAGLAESIQTLADCPVYVTDEPDHTAAQGIKVLLETLSR